MKSAAAAKLSATAPTTMPARNSTSGIPYRIACMAMYL
jgi:hypothetical protein